MMNDDFFFSVEHFSLCIFPFSTLSPSFPRAGFWHVGGGADVGDPGPRSLLLAQQQPLISTPADKSHGEDGSCSP